MVFQYFRRFPQHMVISQRLCFDRIFNGFSICSTVSSAHGQIKSVQFLFEFQQLFNMSEFQQQLFSTFAIVPSTHSQINSVQFGLESQWVSTCRIVPSTHRQITSVQSRLGFHWFVNIFDGSLNTLLYQKCCAAIGIPMCFQHFRRFPQHMV